MDLLQKNSKFINVRGELMSLSHPQVMGIMNITPDSFYKKSRIHSAHEVLHRADQIIEEGGTIVDIGAYSSRANAEHITAQEEMDRLREALEVLSKERSHLILSVDTFRADVARMCVEEYGVAIINDISAGSLDPNMFKTIAKLNVPYILMHMKGTPQNMQQNPTYENFLREVFIYFSQHIRTLKDLGVSDIILDPGFGFAKSLAHNYELLAHTSDFKLFDLPILIGVSRKSMIYKLLNSTPEESLNGTTVLNTMALLQGANILRVHDVKAAAEAIKIVEMTTQYQE